MSNQGIRLIGLGLLCLCAALAWFLHLSVGRVGRNGPTLTELGIAILCFLSFSVGTAALAQGVALLRPAPPRRPVDNPDPEEQTARGEERP